ncbi:MAG: hypothetical protein JWO30_4322 [Fibrobacteres bacterium]|nr:hypothetical protein [Fibrobacterota bacterium]
MPSFKSWILILLGTAGMAAADEVPGLLALNTGTSLPASAGSISAPADHGAYFAPSMRFDAGAGSLEVTFGIEEGARVSLLAFDTQGKLLATLLDGNQGSGFHHLSLFSNRLQGYQGHVIFRLRAGQAVLAETHSRPR